MGSVHVFQIFYDRATRAALDPGFIPLDNTRNERPDWRELWVIRKFLREHTLVDGDWYGFVSPNFGPRTQLDSATIRRFLEFSDQAEVALIAIAWDQVAYFQSPFEQGEVWHPGIAALSQAALREMGYDIDLRSFATCNGNFAFSNFIIGKPDYWREWQKIADAFFDLVEHGTSSVSASLRQTTQYASPSNQVPMKVFVQERLPAIVLAGRRYRTASFDTGGLPISDLFEIDDSTRGVLQTCDLLKRKHRRTGDPRLLDLFREVRRLVGIRFAVPQGG
jgi:hypothetical protein